MAETATEYTLAEVGEHNKESDIWVAYNGQVYDVTKFIDEHPGGSEVLLDLAGKDVTEEFNDVGHSDEAHEILPGLKKGDLKGGEIKTVKTAQSQTAVESPVNFTVVSLVAVIAAVGGYYYYTNFL